MVQEWIPNWLTNVLKLLQNGSSSSSTSRASQQQVCWRINCVRLRSTARILLSPSSIFLTQTQRAYNAIPPPSPHHLIWQRPYHTHHLQSVATASVDKKTLTSILVYTNLLAFLSHYTDWGSDYIFHNIIPTSATSASAENARRKWQERKTTIIKHWECSCALWQNFTPDDFLTFWVIF